jgi:two-component system response regulator PilR (NtrC family)
MPAPRCRATCCASLRAPAEGNVRELENLLHRAVALNDGASCRSTAPAPLSAAFDAPTPAAPVPLLAQAETTRPAPPPLPSDLQAYLDQQEREILVRALHETGFNRTAAAQRLGLSLRQIRYRIARLGITTPGGDDGPSSHADA